MNTENRARSASVVMKMFPVSLKLKKKLSEFEKMTNLHHL